MGRSRSRSPRRISRRSRSRSPRRDRRKRSRSRSRDKRSGRRDRDRDARDKRGRSSSRSRSRSRDRDRDRSRRERELRDRSTSSKREKEKAKTDTTFVQKPEDLEGKTEDEIEMMKNMGFCGFGTTKGKHIEGNDVSAVHHVVQRKYRQYMNRKGGFNRPLDYVN